MKSSIHRFRVNRASPLEGGNNESQTSITARGTGTGSGSGSSRGGAGGSEKDAQQQPLTNSTTPSTPTTAATTTPTPRSSHIPACDRCRSFKKRCSRTFPVCALCASAGQKCSFSTPASSASAQTHHLRARVEWLSKYINETLPVGSAGIENVETGADLAELFAAAVVIQRGGHHHPGRGEVGAASPISRHHHGLPATHPLANHHNVNNSGHSPPSATTITVAASRHGGMRDEMDDQTMLDHGAQNTIEVNLDDMEHQSTNHASPGHRSVVIDPALESGAYDDCTNSGPTANNMTVPRLPPDAAARRFVDAYFRNNRAYPFVDRNKILHELEEFGDFAKRRRDADSTLLYLIMAIGCTTLQRAGQIPNGTASKFDVAYSDIIQECLGREGIESIQILVLLTLYSLFDPAGPSAWSLVGVVARQAMLLGLTRRASDDKTLSPTDVELRHRLFWSIYVLDRMMATTLGLPVALVDENMDVPLPGLTIEEFASPDRSHYAMTLQTSRHVIQLRQMEDRILRQVHFRKQSESSSLTHSDRRAILQDIRAEVENWYSNGCLVSPQEPDNVPIHNSITWLSARYYYLLLLLYYPSHFNSFMGAPVVSKAELLRFAQKHLQSTSALFQQRQLPLNRVSLCRLLPVGLVLIHGYLACAAECSPFPARDEVALLVNMLDAFPEGWVGARRAAHIFRQFLGIINGGAGDGGPGSVSSPSDYGASPMQQQQQQHHHHPHHPFAHTPLGYGAASKESVHTMLRSVMAGLLTLMQDTMGKATCYYKMLEFPEERDSMNIGNGGGGGMSTMGISGPGAGGQGGGIRSSIGGGSAGGGLGGSGGGSNSAEDSVMSYAWGNGHLELDFL